MPDDSKALVEHKKPEDFPAMLKVWTKQIANALPRHMGEERFCRIALTEFRKSEQLQKADPLSVFAANLQAAQTGLEVGVLGQGWIVPYWDKDLKCYIAQFIPGWQGLVDLVNRAGNAWVCTGGVFDGDTFDYALGDRPFVNHRPGGEDDPTKLTHVYAVGRVKGAEWPVVEVWPIGKVWKHRDRYNKQGKAHYSYKNPEMYARKVPLLQVLKYMPKSPELQRAIVMNDKGEIGGQRFDSPKAALDGEFTTIPGGQDNDDSGDRGGGTPTWDDAKFAEKLPGWRRSIEKGTRSLEDVIAAAETLGPLTAAQLAQIKGEQPASKATSGSAAPDVPDTNAVAGADLVDGMKVRAREATITEREVLKFLKRDSFDGITRGEVDRALAFINDPAGESQ